MKDKYLDKLSQSKFYRGGYITLNQHATGMVIESVTKIKFGFLYSRLLIYFHDNGVLDRFGIEVPNNVYPVGCERQRLLQSFYRNKKSIEIESLNLFFDIK